MVLTTLILTAAVLTQPSGDTLVRLVDDTELSGTVEGATHSALTIESDGDLIIVPLSDILSAPGWAPDPELARSAELALLVRLRTASHDTKGAAIAAAELAPRVVGDNSEVARLVSSALYEDAVASARPLDAMVVSYVPGEQGLPEAQIDERYRLPVSAPPITTSRSTGWSLDSALVRQGLNARDALVLDMYTFAGSAAHDQEALEELVTRAHRVNGDLGLELLTHMLLAMFSDDPQQSENAASRLRSRAVSTHGTWTEAWAKLAIASSLLRTPDDERVSRALVELIAVTIHTQDAHPDLAKLARIITQETMLEHGRLEELGRFRDASAPGRPLTRKGR